MDFSIIVPFYNNGSHVTRLFLTLGDYIDNNMCEIIIVDDCSNIEDFLILSEYIEKTKANNIYLIRNKNNRGAAFSRQRGVEMAKGNYIAFLDADDGWVKNRIFILSNYMKQYSINILGGATLVIDQENFQTIRDTEFRITISKHLNFKDFLFKNYFSTPSVIVRRDIFLKNGFDTTMRYSEDFECWRRIVLDGKAFSLLHTGCYSFKHVFISQNGLSSNTLKMSIGELQGLIKLLGNPIIGFSDKMMVLVSLLYSIVKAVIREIRVKI